MASLKLYPYQPDYAVHPGRILKEHLSARHMKQSDLARLCGLSPKHVSQIVNGNAPVTPETAIQFERIFGLSANIWSNLDADYRLHTARAEEQKRLANMSGWVKRFPVNELRNRGLLPATRDTAETAKALLKFFRLGDFERWKDRYDMLAVACRKSPSFESSAEAVAAWLRIGELEAENILTEPYSAAKFRKSLDEIRRLTRDEPSTFEPRMRELCRVSGVGLVFVPEFRETHLSGATKWLNRGKALIIQSLRYKKDDHFWFTFFHEAAHILLHGKNRKNLFIDETKMGTNEKEEEANRFAANTLVPEAKYRAFVRKGRFHEADILEFAEQLGIAPGIVVGRLQHDGHIPYNRHNNLKRTFQLEETTADEAG